MKTIIYNTYKLIPRPSPVPIPIPILIPKFQHDAARENH